MNRNKEYFFTHRDNAKTIATKSRRSLVWLCSQTIAVKEESWYRGNMRNIKRNEKLFAYLISTDWDKKFLKL